MSRTYEEYMEQLQIVNEPSHESMRTACEEIVKELEAQGKTELTDEEITEAHRRIEDRAKQKERERLVAKYGEDDVFDTTQLSEHFEGISFAAPKVRVRRLVDNQFGSLYFTHRPRLYYGFEADRS